MMAFFAVIQFFDVKKGLNLEKNENYIHYNVSAVLLSNKMVVATEFFISE
jgi:hypothetical protein